MAEFTTGIGGPQDTSITVKQPTQRGFEPSPFMAAADSLMGNAQVALQAARAYKAPPSYVDVGQFNSELEGLNQAYKNGQIGADELQIRARQLRAQYSAPGAQNVSQVNTIFGEFTDTSPGYKVKSQQELEQEFIEEQTGQAMSNGFISVGDTPDQAALGLQSFIAQQQEIKALELKQKQLSILNSQQNLSEGAYNFDRMRAEHAILDGFARLSEHNFTRTNNVVAETVGMYDKDKTPASRTAALQQLAALETEIVNQASAIGGGRIDKAKLDQIIASHLGAINLARDKISGKIEDSVYETELTRLKRQSTSEAIQDPQIRKVYGLVSLVGPNAITDYTNLLSTSAYLAKVGDGKENPLPTDLNKQERKDSNALIINALKSTSGMADSPYKGDYINQIQDYVNGQLNVLGKGDQVVKPGDLNTVVDFFADPAVGAAVARGDVTIPNERANEFVKVYYADQLAPAIQGVLGTDVGGVPVADLFTPEFIGGEVKFVPTPAYHEFMATTASNNTASSVFNRGVLKKSQNDINHLAKRLTASMKAMATLSGNPRDLQTQFNLLMGGIGE